MYVCTYRSLENTVTADITIITIIIILLARKNSTEIQMNRYNSRVQKVVTLLQLPTKRT